MEEVKLPPWANVVRLLSGHLAADFKGRVEDLTERLVGPGKPPVALLACRGGGLENEAGKLELLSNACRDLSQLDEEDEDEAETVGEGDKKEKKKKTKKQLQVVLLVSVEASEDAIRAALQRLPAAIGGSMSMSGQDPTSEGESTGGAGNQGGAPLPPNPQPPWVAVACVPLEADMFGNMLLHKTEMLVLLLEILTSSTGGLALFPPNARGLSREGQVVLHQFGAVAAWPYSESRLLELEEATPGTSVGVSAGSKHPLSELLIFPPTTQPPALLKPSPSAAQTTGETSEKVPLEVIEKSGIVALYLGASWCEPCAPFTAKLGRVTKEVMERHGGGSMSVVFLSFDDSESSFLSIFSEMPSDWTALPLAASAATRDKVSSIFGLRGIPCLVLLKGDGTLVTTEGRDLIMELGSEAYPFATADVAAAREARRARKEKLKAEQTLSSLLCNPQHDYLVDKEGNKVMVSELEGKKVTVGLYFASQDSYLCTKFVETLRSAYEGIKSSGGAFEIVLVAMDEDEEGYKEQLKDCPWLALPFVEGAGEAAWRQDLRDRFDSVKGLPFLAILDAEGKTLTEDGADRIRELGAKSFPFG